ncbi:MAG TPA: hypothetical protein VFM24_01240 [Nitrospira sp.]|jgi:hypothetical protein|nr:hypothetical protein [Nitrospira sp.]
MSNWAKKLVEELHGAGASPEHLWTVLVAIVIAVLFIVLLVTAVVLFQ